MTLNMNYTLDDAAAQLVFSSGWAIQSSSDPNLPEFFERTYHAVQSPGATLNISVQGTALYIYGSKGSNHANYSVQFDDLVINLSANAPQTQFQQLLFAETLDPSKSVHFISLTAMPNGSNDWLDIDYVTVATGNMSAPPVTGLPNTVSVPWTSSSTSVSATVTSSATDPAGNVSMNKETDKSNTLTEILAIVFGLIIALFILLLLVYWLLRRRYDRHRAKEHSFRLGQAERAAADALASNSPVPLGEKAIGAAYAHMSPPSVTSRHPLLSPTTNASSAAFSVGRTTTTDLSLAEPPVRPSARPLPSPPLSPGPAGVARSLTLTSMASSGLTATNTSDLGQNALPSVVDTETDPRPTSPARQSPRPFAFLSQAPSSFQMTLPGMRADKGDADSLKTDFLQLHT